MLQAGQNIKAIRELKNFTQDYVASHLNMSVPNYSNIETGKTDVTLTRLQQIAEVLQIDYLQIIHLNRTEIFNAASNGKSESTHISQHEMGSELIRQLQIKDEQINRLLAIVERSNS
ncbi:MAG TPA: helix-turn-helix transcriptional regulator [Puia sp.]|nr:helix-turn-helix transcriptional regulator [Puia sp.]